MSQRRLVARARGLLTLAALAIGCGAKAPALEPSALPKKPVAAPAKAKPPKHKLLAALRAVQRPAPLLELFSAPALQVLDARLQSLSPEQRQELVAGDLAETMPLLHLKAGGSSGVALLAHRR